MTKELKLNELIDAEGELFQVTATKISKDEKSYTQGAIDVAKTEDGYMVLDGQHRTLEAIQKGDKKIVANILSREEAISKYADRWMHIEQVLA